MPTPEVDVRYVTCDGTTQVAAREARSITNTDPTAAMREAIGLKDKSVDILTHIDGLSSEKLKQQANLRISEVEAKAMREMQPQPGLVALLEYLTANKVSKNICTRNLIKPVNHLLSNFVPPLHSSFDHIVTRDFRPTKPYPDPLLHIARQLNVAPENMLMVGDSFDDMQSGTAAGCATVLVKNDSNVKLLAAHPELVDAVVDDLADIIGLLQEGFEARGASTRE